MSFTTTALKALPPRSFLNALQSFTWVLEDFATGTARKLSSNTTWLGPAERQLVRALLLCAERHAATIVAFHEVGALLVFEPSQKTSLEALMECVKEYETMIDESVGQLEGIRSTW